MLVFLSESITSGWEFNSFEWESQMLTRDSCLPSWMKWMWDKDKNKRQKKKILKNNEWEINNNNKKLLFNKDALNDKKVIVKTQIFKFQIIA